MSFNPRTNVNDILVFTSWNFSDLLCIMQPVNVRVMAKSVFAEHKKYCILGKSIKIIVLSITKIQKLNSSQGVYTHTHTTLIHTHLHTDIYVHIWLKVWWLKKKHSQFQSILAFITRCSFCYKWPRWCFHNIAWGALGSKTTKTGRLNFSWRGSTRSNKPIFLVPYSRCFM